MADSKDGKTPDARNRIYVESFSYGSQSGFTIVEQNGEGNPRLLYTSPFFPGSAGIAQIIGETYLTAIRAETSDSDLETALGQASAAITQSNSAQRLNPHSFNQRP